MSNFKPNCPLNSEGDCEKELTPQGAERGSIGVVGDGEALARVVSSSDWSGAGDIKLQRSLLKKEELRERAGWSFIRADMIDGDLQRARIKELGLRIRSIDEENLMGFATVSAGFIRDAAQSEMKKRALCIIDDAKSYKEHASVEMSCHLSDGEINRIRKRLLRNMERAMCFLGK